MRLRVTISFFVLLFTLTSSFGQISNIENKQRALFIINATSQFNWPRAKEISELSILIIKDKALYTEFQSLSKTRTINGIPIKASFASGIPQIKNSDVIYSNLNDGLIAYDILAKIKSNKTLFIGENYKFNECHINLLRIKDEFVYEINSGRLQAIDLGIPTTLKDASVESSSKWYQLYGETEINLSKEIEKSNTLKATITKKELKIDSLSSSIKSLNSKVTLLNEEVELSQNALNNLNHKKDSLAQILISKTKNIEVLTSRIEESEAKVNAQLAILNSLKSEIKDQRVKLSELNQLTIQQNKEIKTQKESIVSKENKLTTQRKITILFITFAFLIGLIALLLLRSNRFRKNSNQLLLQKNQQIEQRKNEMEQFAYIASHDLLAPINTILGFSELLQDKAKDYIEDVDHLYLKEISGSSHRMKALIRDLLEFSLIGQEGLDENFSIHHIIQEVKSDLEADIKKNNAQINIITSEEINLYARKTEIRSLLQNLIANGLKFRRIETDPILNIEISQSTKDKEIKTHFSIEDNGIGIEPKFRNKVFNVFSRLHGEEEYSGTGIGLANCKKIVERHHGEIWIEEAVNGGSKFNFFITSKPSPE